MKPTRRQFLQSLGYGAAAGVGLFGYGRVMSGSIVVERRELRLPKWDAGEIRVALLADTHLDYPEAVDRTKEAVRLAMGEKPDLIAHVGDFITSAHPYHLQAIEDAFEELHDAKCPVLGVLGNHDYWAGYFSLVMNALSKSPIRILRNETVDLDGFVVAGIDDALEHKNRPDLITSDANSLIALFHEPDFVEEVPESVSVQLSGHSHGGQICLPGGERITTPKGALKYVAGFYPEAKVPLYVSRGIGTTGPRYRLYCPPELSILTLRSA